MNFHLYSLINKFYYSKLNNEFFFFLKIGIIDIVEMKVNIEYYLEISKVE